MENFNNNSFESHDEIMKYLNEVMKKLTYIENESSLKDKQLYNYDLEVKRLQQENFKLHTQLNYYKQIEPNLNSSMEMIRSTSEQIRSNAMKEREVIISDAKNNASRILNDALVKAERINMEASNLKSNVNVYKGKLRSIINLQLEMIDDIDKIDI